MNTPQTKTLEETYLKPRTVEASKNRFVQAGEDMLGLGILGTCMVAGYYSYKTGFPWKQIAETVVAQQQAAGSYAMMPLSATTMTLPLTGLEDALGIDTQRLQDLAVKTDVVMKDVKEIGKVVSICALVGAGFGVLEDSGLLNYIATHYR